LGPSTKLQRARDILRDEGKLAGLTLHPEVIPVNPWQDPLELVGGVICFDSRQEVAFVQRKVDKILASAQTALSRPRLQALHAQRLIIDAVQPQPTYLASVCTPGATQAPLQAFDVGVRSLMDVIMLDQLPSDTRMENPPPQEKAPLNINGALLSLKGGKGFGLGSAALTAPLSFLNALAYCLARDFGADSKSNPFWVLFPHLHEPRPLWKNGPS
jgi:hypothetical protein